MIAPIEFGPVDFMQERNKVAGQFTDNPFGAYLGGLIGNLRPRGDSTPIYFDDHMKQYAPRPFGPQQFPEYMKAGGPELFPIKKDLPGEVKGTIRGVQGGSRNDLGRPFGGLRKAGLFNNEGYLS